MMAQAILGKFFGILSFRLGSLVAFRGLRPNGSSVGHYFVLNFSCRVYLIFPLPIALG
jgi:hypothetical protein